MKEPKVPKPITDEEIDSDSTEDGGHEVPPDW